MAKKTKQEYINRTLKFQIFPTEAQEQLLLFVSDVCGEAYSWGVEHFEEIFREREADWEFIQSAFAEVYPDAPVPEKEDVPFRRYPTFFDLMEPLKWERAKHPSWGRVPFNVLQETIDSLVGSFASFFDLKKKEDPDARPPTKKDGTRFTAIPGLAVSFKIKHDAIHIAPRVFNGMCSFTIPEYQLRKINDCLEIEGGQVAKFIISRKPATLAEGGRYWMSITCKWPRPEVVPVESKHEYVYLALGASSIGVYAPSIGYERVITLWRPDKHWMRGITAVDARLDNPALEKGSIRWKLRSEARRIMYDKMSKQQRQNHREVVASLVKHITKDGVLRGVGKHFVVTDYVVRSKKSKLADASKKERSGIDGLNFAAQNTGSFRDLVAQLEEKVKEVGGSVVRHKLTTLPPKGIGKGHENKIHMAQHLTTEFSTV